MSPSRPPARIPGIREMTAAPHRPGVVLVKLKRTLGPAARVAALQELGEQGAVHERNLGLVPGLRRMRVPAGVPMETVLERLNANPSVEYAEPDYEVQLAIASTPSDPNDPSTASGADAWHWDKVNAHAAWARTTDATAIGPIAIFDTGLQRDHPDLSSNLWANPGEIAGNGVDDDGNGYVDDVHGLELSSFDHHHATAVAGLVGAQGGDGIGVLGAAWDCELMDLKLVHLESTVISNIVEALEYAIGEGSRLSNHSWGILQYSQVVADAVDSADQAGHLMVVAAHNQGSDIDLAPVYPASLGHRNIITVAASDGIDQRAGFSNFGVVSVDLAAPGRSVLSSRDGSTYGTFDGTSLATPIVTGAVALAWAQVPQWGHREIREHLLSSVRPASGWSGLVATGGILDMGALMSNLGPRLSVVPGVVGESDGSFGIQVTLQPPAAVTVTAGLETRDQSARDGSDYFGLRTRISFAPGETSKTVRVNVIDDVEYEGDEAFEARLTAVSGAETGTGSVLITLLDDEQSPLQPMVQDVTGGSDETGVDVVGYQFRVTEPVTVSELGVFDANENGVLDNSGDTSIGLWTADGALLATALVSSATPPIDGVFYGPVDAVQLTPGFEYVLGNTAEDGGEPYRSEVTADAVPQMAWTGHRTGSGPGLTFPTTFQAAAAGAPPSYFGPTLRLASSPTPPAPLLATFSIFTADFDASADGFSFADDTFRGTAQPAYAAGMLNLTGGFTGGGPRGQSGRGR